METIATQTLAVATDWAATSGVHTMLFDFLDRALFGGVESSFCATQCPLVAAGRCECQLAHRFGCYEAERSAGKNIYYCPASLVFIATVIYGKGRPAYGLISGPIVAGSEQPLEDLEAGVREHIGDLPRRETGVVDALARMQRSVGANLSTQATPSPRSAAEASSPSTKEPAAAKSSEVASGQVVNGEVITAFSYPLDVEKQLVQMIRRGDRAGAAELINRLLASLYLDSDGELSRLRRGAAELMTLFSRAAIDGGADAASIFGEQRVRDRRLENAQTLEDVSGMLVSAFNRFVGYVFDFSQFQHANVLRQTVNYIRRNYANRFTLTDVAREVAMSPNYLSSIFSAEMGCSFTTYVQGVRIEKSKELLVNTDKTIAEIAAETGFTDQSYFNKVFTKTAGMSPARFRREELSHYG